MDAREHPADIIAQTIRMFARTEGAGRVGEIAISQLEAAGFTILHDSENHGPTRDRAAEICERPVIGFQDGAVEASRYLASAIRAMGEKK